MSDTQFNLARVFDTVAEAVPDREAIVWGDRCLSFSDLAERSRRLGAYLAAQGLGAHGERSELSGHESGQDHLGIYLYNGNEYLEAMLGCFRARVAPFNVNYRYVADELVYLLDNSSCRALVYHASFAPTLAAIRDKLPELQVLIQVADESDNELLPGAVDYDSILAEVGDAAVDALPEPSADDLYMLYTGGTTGMPKGVLWRQHDIFLNAMGGRNFISWQPVETYEELATTAQAIEPLRFLTLPPLMHGAAQWSSFIALNGGNTVCFQDNPRRLDPAEVWNTIVDLKITTITTVGDAMARPLIEELERGDYDPSSLFVLGNGGAALTPTIKERWLAKIPNLIVSDSVGASETGAQMSHLSSAGAVSTGRFRPGPGAAVISEDLGRVLGAEETDVVGWLAQDGWVPLGYLGDADKTARTFPVLDGVRYAVPGDRARYLEDGEIELLGRDSVTINSGGEKIFAEEVERAIAGHPAIHDVVVVGRPSERWGQEVVALVELSAGQEATAEALIEHASQHIARYKLPKDVVFLNHIQRSPSGKADYRWARSQVEN